MAVEEMIILVWALIMTVIFVILVVVLLNLKKKHEQDIRYKEDEIQDMNEKLEQKQSKSFQMGVNTTSGDYTQILGDFALLANYDQIITLSTTSKQPSLDLIGINDESLDFLEIKKKGAKISSGENRVRRLVEEKKVSYKVFDMELPDGFTMEERKLKRLKGKVEEKKISYKESDKELPVERKERRKELEDKIEKLEDKLEDKLEKLKKDKNP